LLLALAFTASAEASAIKLLDGNTNTEVTVYDQQAGDMNPAEGAVTYIGSVGDWMINVTTGTTQPALGTLTDPEMNFSDISALSTASGTLTLWFSEVGFTTTPGQLQADFGGTTPGTVTYQVFQGASLFDTTSQPAPLTALTSTTSPFMGSQSVFLPAAGPYSLTQQVTIVHSQPGTATSYGANVSYSSVPDGGATLSLLGLALVGVAGLRTRLR
jgi:hypothetical protein